MTTSEPIDYEQRYENAERRIEELETDKRAAERTVEELRGAAAEVTEAMEAAAAGDLSGRLRVDSDDEDVRAMVRAFNRMTAEMAYTLSTAQAFAEDVDEASGDVTTVAEDIRKEIERVNDSTANISAITTQQREKIEHVSEEVADLSATVEEVTTTAENVAETAERTADRGQEGRAAAEQAIDEFDRIEEEIQRAQRSMTELSEYMAEVDEIIEFIDDVAKQTNILALNANIEAARATEAGSGFEVVAEEVKSLAEETKSATEEIESLIETIRDQSEETAGRMETAEESVTTSSETVGEALDALDEIAERAIDTNTGVQTIEEATHEQAGTAQEVAQMADDVAELAEVTADETDSVVEAVDTHRDRFGTAVQSIKDLSGQLTFLREELEDFDVGAAERARLADRAGEPMRTSRAEAGEDAVVVGSKTYTANVVLSHMVYELLDETTDLEPVANFRLGMTDDNFEAVRTGETDVYWSYTGTIVEQFLSGAERAGDVEETSRLAGEVESEFDLVLGERAELVQTYALAAPRVWCDETGITTIPELMASLTESPDVVLAYEGDFRDREDGWAGLADRYDLPESTRRELRDRALVVEDAEERFGTAATGEADVVQGTVADAWIDVHDLVVLADVDDFFPSYQPVPLVNADAAGAHPELVEAVDRIGPTLRDVEQLRRLSRKIKIGGKDPRVVAREHLRNSGLL